MNIFKRRSIVSNFLSNNYTTDDFSRYLFLEKIKKTNTFKHTTIIYQIYYYTKKLHFRQKRHSKLTLTKHRNSHNPTKNPITFHTNANFSKHNNPSLPNNIQNQLHSQHSTALRKTIPHSIRIIRNILANV